MLAERHVGAVLLAGVLAVAPLPASGAGEEPPAEAEVQARARFSEGNLAYDLAEFQQALDAYSEAYRLVPLPGFLFNIAQCHRQLGNAERAAFFYRRYLALSETEPPNAALVNELIAEMDAAARREQQRRLAREQVERERAKATALKEQAEAVAARRAEEGGWRQPPGPGGSGVSESGEHLLEKWWVWAGAGAVVLLAGGAVYAATAPQPRSTTLGTVR
ncbi:MAG TPA: tetratricopeptide repeat protein [Myxococcaceae bacterium]|nr:tetratricopeptide repeat protein [Myxococcaceae bacterium]